MQPECQTGRAEAWGARSRAARNRWSPPAAREAGGRLWVHTHGSPRAHRTAPLARTAPRRAPRPPRKQLQAETRTVSCFTSFFHTATGKTTAACPPPLPAPPARPTLQTAPGSRHRQGLKLRDTGRDGENETQSCSETSPSRWNRNDVQLQLQPEALCKRTLIQY